MRFQSFYVIVSIAKGMSVITKECPAHEVPALSYIHKRVVVDALKVNPDTGEPVTKEFFEPAEYARLANRYGDGVMEGAYGPQKPRLLESMLDIVEEMLADDSELVTEHEEAERARRDKARQARLAQLAQRKDVQRPRKAEKEEIGQFASKAAKKLAEENGLTAADIPEGTGSNGMITKADVEAVLQESDGAEGDSDEAVDLEDQFEPDAWAAFAEAGFTQDDVEIEGDIILIGGIEVEPTGDDGKITVDDLEKLTEA